MVFFDKALNSAKVREKVQINSSRAGFCLPGYPSQAGSKPGDAPKGAPISLWPLGAAGVQIPLPAPIFKAVFELILYKYP
jgi:hypothetical protein